MYIKSISVPLCSVNVSRDPHTKLLHRISSISQGNFSRTPMTICMMPKEFANSIKIIANETGQCSRMSNKIRPTYYLNGPLMGNTTHFQSLAISKNFSNIDILKSILMRKALIDTNDIIIIPARCQETNKHNVFLLLASVLL